MVKWCRLTQSQRRNYGLLHALKACGLPLILFGEAMLPVTQHSHCSLIQGGQALWARLLSICFTRTQSLKIP